MIDHSSNVGIVLPDMLDVLQFFFDFAGNCSAVSESIFKFLFKVWMIDSSDPGAQRQTLGNDWDHDEEMEKKEIGDGKMRSL